jgi:dihydrofolate synthase/folylpolyglutamate synthase
MGGAYARFLARLETTRTLGVSFGLDRVRAALAALGNPERRLASVQIAGTNGKGSTSAMAESILRAAGLRTGLFTSPHLARFTERIRIDGREIDGDVLAALDARVSATGVPLTYFEISAVLAFLAMAEAGVEAAVLETGLGGRLDAVTACVPVATAITSIALDHTDLLGPTLVDIAREKAGIAKPGVPLFLGPVPPEAEREIRRVAAASGADVRLLGPDLDVPAGPLGLQGEHQRPNAALAVALAEALAAAAGRLLPPAAIAEGLARVRWPGRLERLAPDLLLDCAHNAQGARALAAALPPARPRALVVSIVRGKEAEEVLGALVPRFDAVFVTRSRNERSLPPELLAPVASSLGGRDLRVEVVPDPMAALLAARAFVRGSAAARPDGDGDGDGVDAHAADDPAPETPPAEAGLVVVAGSIFLVGELRARVLDEPADPLPGGDPLP